MKIQRQNETVRITRLRELCATNAQDFREKVEAALTPEVTTVEIDLSLIPFIDSSGLAALVAVHKAANGGQVAGPVNICLLDPTPAVRQVVELTRMDCVFQIEYRESAVPEDNPRPASEAASST
jgi:anti-sigma B factor antagonist